MLTIEVPSVMMTYSATAYGYMLSLHNKCTHCFFYYCLNDIFTFISPSKYIKPVQWNVTMVIYPSPSSVASICAAMPSCSTFRFAWLLTPLVKTLMTPCWQFDVNQYNASVFETNEHTHAYKTEWYSCFFCIIEHLKMNWKHCWRTSKLNSMAGYCS